MNEMNDMNEMNEMNESDTLECCFNHFESLLKQTK